MSKPDNNTLIRRKRLFLKMITGLAKEDYNPPGILRGLLTCWFAHAAGEGFFTRNGNPRWLNTKNIASFALQDFHGISSQALALLKTGMVEERSLVIDHATPISTIWKKIRGKRKLADVEKTLLNETMLVVVTREEHDGPLAEKSELTGPKRYRKAKVALASKTEIKEVDDLISKRKVRPQKRRKTIRRE